MSSSAIKMAASGRRHHHLHHHGHHHHLKSRETVHFKPSTDSVPFPSIPWIVPAVYNVSWNFNVKDWPHDSNITFRAGDILVFNYDQDMHNVVPVDEANYLNCSIPEIAAAVYTSGHDSIVLGPGKNYFICGTMGHCIAGMFINVSAA
ncbi:basic blue protein-like [Heracleum sosnowskyi]|uniref:Basic blue protein-like n=1 Tax=Heracleum sosnowskyi TaxID=360622 RepID=A0AAD8JDV0_9APIA|nr:basic blue protein-like [Heracleum sosnowskyi]